MKRTPSKIFFLTALLLIVWTRPAVAEPDENISFLIHDSISLLDFGIYRLENDLKGFRNDLLIRLEAPHSAFVDYDWDENKILIVLSYGDPGNPSISEIRSEIKAIVAIVKKKFGVAATGEPFQKGGSSSIGDYFSHKGFSRKNMPPNLKRNIDKRVEIKVVFYVQNYSRYFECRNRLVGSSSAEITCTGYLP